jgi:hypothetical protein
MIREPTSRTTRVLLPYLLLLSPLAFGTAPVNAQEPPTSGRSQDFDVVIGMVIDGPWERNDELLPLFRGEIEELVREDFGAGKTSGPESPTIES